MSTEFKHSREACLVAKRLFQTSRYVSKFLETYHEIKHKLHISTQRLKYTRSQLNQNKQTAIEMCMSKHPLINSTHVGEENYAGVINNWAVVSTHTDQHGAVHHSTNPAVYVFVILLLVALFAALLIWFCKGQVWTWFMTLFKRTATQQQNIGSRQSPQGLPQHVVSITQDERLGNGYLQRAVPLVPTFRSRDDNWYVWL